jgi:hypothetical protein
MARKSRKDWHPKPGATVLLVSSDAKVSSKVLAYIDQYGFAPEFRYEGKDWWAADFLASAANADGEDEVEREMLEIMGRLGPEAFVGFEPIF